MGDQYDDLLKDLPGKSFHLDAFVRYGNGFPEGAQIHAMRRQMAQRLANTVTDSPDHFKSREDRVGVMPVGVRITLDAVIMTQDERRQAIIDAYKKGFSDGNSRSGLSMMMADVHRPDGGKNG